MKKEILFGLPVHRMRIDPKSYDKKTIIKTINICLAWHYFEISSNAIFI